MNKELDLILQKKLKECDGNENEGIDNLRLIIVGAGGVPLLDLLRPDVITTTRLLREEVAFDITRDDTDFSVEKNFYFVYGKLAGMIKSIPLAIAQIHDQPSKDILRHNVDMLQGVIEEVYDECLKTYPDGIVSAMKSDRYGPLM